MKTRNIVVATMHPWNIASYRAWHPPVGFRKVLISKKEDLTAQKLKKIDPLYVFIPHWSWIIPADVFEQFECIVFHMTDLPFGRGGSPLQNLIVRGIYKTKISALRVMAGIDEGPIYLKRSFDISRGSALKLYQEFSRIAFGMMSYILERRPEPRPQTGAPVVFKRRTPEESELPEDLSPRQKYDFIRMLDAPGYPVAYVPAEGGRIELRDAKRIKGRVIATEKFVHM